MVYLDEDDPYLNSLVAILVVDDEVTQSSSDAFKLGLCQFTKDLFHYVAPFSDYEQLLPADTPSSSQPHLSAGDKFVANLFG